MPQFQLNANERGTHPFYALDDFAKGYVEAMFFTNGDTGDGNETLLNELGVERLTRAAVADIAADCALFYATNHVDIHAATCLHPGAEDFRYAKETLDLRRCGHLFWYARQGHGVSWKDDGNAECLARLQKASRQFGEAYCEVSRGWIYHR